MATILRFPIERVAPALPSQKGHRCLVIPFPQKTVSSVRKQLIAKAKIAQKQLGIGDADYRVLLQDNFGVNSCKALDEDGLVLLIDFYRSKGWRDKPVRSALHPRKALDRHGKPNGLKVHSNPSAPVLQRIEALLSELGKARGKYIPWDYAAGILKKHTGLDNLDTATVRELQSVMVALERTLNSERRGQ